MILLDGAYGEGGGQILRTALALSLATGKSFAIERVRANRPRPGLKAQHLAALRAIGALTASRFSDVQIGQDSLRFSPGPFLRTRAGVDIGTAGSITLLLQSLLLPLAVRGGKGETALELTGGTDVPWSPQADYTSRVFLPSVEGIVSARLSLLRRGYYPKGGGRILLDVLPPAQSAERPLNLSDRGEMRGIGGISHGSRDLAGARVAERQAAAAAAALGDLTAEIGIDAVYGPSLSAGSGITLWAVFSPPPGEDRSARPVILGSDALGARGKRAERVGEEAASALREEIASGAAVDIHLADHLVPWIGLFGGALRASRISDHVRSAAYVTGLFLGEPPELDEEEATVRVRGD